MLQVQCKKCYSDQKQLIILSLLSRRFSAKKHALIMTNAKHKSQKQISISLEMLSENSVKICILKILDHKQLILE